MRRLCKGKKRERNPYDKTPNTVCTHPVVKNRDPPGTKRAAGGKRVEMMSRVSVSCKDQLNPLACLWGVKPRERPPHYA